MKSSVEVCSKLLKNIEKNFLTLESHIELNLITVLSKNIYISFYLGICFEGYFILPTFISKLQ